MKSHGINNQTIPEGYYCLKTFTYQHLTDITVETPTLESLESGVLQVSNVYKYYYTRNNRYIMENKY